ncbi:MAG: helix-turn-helix domain-containing protein [Bacteroidales bacterium]
MKKAEEHSSSIIENILNNISKADALKVEKRMALAVLIDEAIKAKEWKRKDLAEALQIKNLSVITRWLSGTHNFTVDTLSDIERVLEIKLLNIDTKPKEQSISIKITVSKDNKSIQMNPIHNFGFTHQIESNKATLTNKFQYPS